uniref:gamma-butyrobetaine dioxygenase-like n=1 Tax=Ciona intestinalis TaxID=7719 RepID=UPI000180CBE5|nr:gamma-butyrobetaine dioxygenase-like [Ciona intestinalis]|eukprot:XP_002120966.1 gamma-butyrobetaine dioxygenase-like [Ciona intestinalis]
MAATVDSFQIGLGQNLCEVLWKDEHVSRFHAKWLRFNCRCVKCYSEVAATYLIDVPSFPLDMKIATVKVEDSTFKVSFAGDDHVSILPSDWLRSKCYCDVCLELKLQKADVITQYIESNAGKKKEIPQMEYEDILTKEGMFNWIGHVITSGVCIVRNVQPTPEKLEEIAERVANIEETTYGKLSVVKISSTEGNAAYSNIKLPFHQDQTMYEKPPGIEFLHCMKFDECITGGETKIVDLYEVINILKRESPADFQTLVEVPVIYSTIDYKRTNKVYLHHQKHVVVLDYFGKVVAINWHPALLSTLQVREKDVERYYEAHVKLLQIIRRDELHFTHRMQPGDLVVFNNRRVLHSRNKFEANGGDRQLQTTYASADNWKNRYMTLAHQLNRNVVAPKIGNGSSI